MLYVIVSCIGNVTKHCTQGYRLIIDVNRSQRNVRCTGSSTAYTNIILNMAC